MHKIATRWISSSRQALAKVTTSGASKVKAPILGRPSNNLTSGVVGLANVGKSTFFQSMTRTSLGIAANYPFATIDPSKSVIMVQSPELKHLQQLYQSNKMIASNLTIYDIAGLTRNAASGAGLGNKFLADIRMVDGIFHVVRGFKDDEIIHIENNGIIDPVRDLVIVNDELILKDLEFVESGVERVTKMKKKPGVVMSQVELELATLAKLQDCLYEGRKVSSESWCAEEVEIINGYNLITAKPTVYLLNVSEEDFSTGQNEFKDRVQQWIDENCPEDRLLMFSAQHEAKVAQKIEEGQSTEQSQSVRDEVVDTMRQALGLISFYTCGPQEARQWTLRQGSFAPDAAGVIHTDLQKTFISALVYKYADLAQEEAPLNEANLKSKGKQHRCGKNYEVEDGDVMLIKAAGGKKR